MHVCKTHTHRIGCVWKGLVWQKRKVQKVIRRRRHEEGTAAEVVNEGKEAGREGERKEGRRNSKDKGMEAVEGTEEGIERRLDEGGE